jgi:hypothetical protein
MLEARRFHACEVDGEPGTLTRCVGAFRRPSCRRLAETAAEAWVIVVEGITTQCQAGRRTHQARDAAEVTMPLCASSRDTTRCPSGCVAGCTCDAEEAAGDAACGGWPGGLSVFFFCSCSEVVVACCRLFCARAVPHAGASGATDRCSAHHGVVRLWREAVVCACPGRKHSTCSAHARCDASRAEQAPVTSGTADSASAG